MSVKRALRKAATVAFWRPAAAFAVMKPLLPALFHPWDPMGLDWERGPHSDSLAYRGFSGRFSATILTLFVKRSDVQSSLPPELKIVDDDRLPDWLQGRDDHPVILLFGRQTDLGNRRPIFGLYQTFRLFRPYLETFVAVPFLEPKASQKPSPCLHFVRVPCNTFWPTEMGILQMGWPKIQCPMEMREEGQTLHYSITDPESGRPLFAAETDLSDPVGLTAGDACLEKVASMLSPPHVLFVGRIMDTYRFDLRLEAAGIRAVSARGTVHPGLLPSITSPIDFAVPKISQSEFGAMFVEATFMNRALKKSPRTFLSTVREYLRK
ncbi:MAG TPA: hypothetical protein VMY37_34700 [Thermoguttaceae bacterium]|nr:hypothetical protein [Thermoguttaceae bacterium]